MDKNKHAADEGRDTSREVNSDKETLDMEASLRAHKEQKKKEDDQKKEEKAKEEAEELARAEEQKRINEKEGDEEEEEAEDIDLKRHRAVAKSRQLIKSFSERDQADLQPLEVVQLIVAERVFWLGEKVSSEEINEDELHATLRQFDFLSALADKLAEPEVEASEEIEEVYREIVKNTTDPETFAAMIHDESHSHTETADDQLLVTLSHAIHEEEDCNSTDVQPINSTKQHHSHGVEIAVAVTSLAAACHKLRHLSPPQSSSTKQPHSTAPQGISLATPQADSPSGYGVVTPPITSMIAGRPITPSSMSRHDLSSPGLENAINIDPGGAVAAVDLLVHSEGEQNVEAGSVVTTSDYSRATNFMNSTFSSRPVESINTSPHSFESPRTKSATGQFSVVNSSRISPNRLSRSQVTDLNRPEVVNVNTSSPVGHLNNYSSVSASTHNVAKKNTESWLESPASFTHASSSSLQSKPVDSWSLDEMLHAARSIHLGNGQYLHDTYRSGSIDREGLVKVLKDWKKGKDFKRTFHSQRERLSNKHVKEQNGIEVAQSSAKKDNGEPTNHSIDPIDSSLDQQRATGDGSDRNISNPPSMQSVEQPVKEPQSADNKVQANSPLYMIIGVIVLGLIIVIIMHFNL